MQQTANDLDYLASRLHGRRSETAEDDRLYQLCGIRSIPELGEAIYPETELQTSASFQRKLIEDLVLEMADISQSLTGTSKRLVHWLLVRFQVENLKVLLRILATQNPPPEPEEHWVTLPESLELDNPALIGTKSLIDFATRMPSGKPKESLLEAIESYGPEISPFFIEAALDRGYFRELLARTRQVAEEKELLQPLVFQEVDIFHLMLVARGKFHYRLSPGLLTPLQIAGTAISQKKFTAMLTTSNLRALALEVYKRIIDELPDKTGPGNGKTVESDAPELEKFAWIRFLDLAHRAFRQSDMSLGVVLGYLGIRRVEVANLITISEGIRAAMPVEEVRRRVIPQTDLQRAYV